MQASLVVCIGRFTRANRAAILSLIAVLLAGGCEAGGATLVDPAAPAGPSGVSVDPTSVAVVAGGPAQIAPSGTLSLHAVALDATGDTLTGATFTWSTTDPSVATIDASGVATGVAPGTASVTATSGAVTSPAFALTVVSSGPGPAATAAISAATSSIAVAATTQAVAVVRDAGGTTLTGAPLTWASSNARVATVSGGGLITGVTAGTANITAMSGTVTSNAMQIAVVNGPLASVTVTAGAATVATFQALQAQAVAKDASGNVLTAVHVTWTSSNAAVATVDGSGVVTGVAPGGVTIKATAGSVTSNALALTVVNPPVASVKVTAPSSKMDLKSKMQAQAVAMDASGHVLQGITFSWASSNAKAATVSSSGLITAKFVGTTDITAMSGGVRSNAVAVTVLK